MDNLLIGTAGHIDHGKTALIEALSGVLGDSTPQEKQRGITIDLSFVHVKQEGKRVSFIDVPGHEDLVKNMIAGSFSLDAVLFVISAAEGIMPQTREHLQICRLLGLERFIVVLSKSDLASPQKIQEVRTQTDQLFAQIGLDIESMHVCSTHDHESIVQLKKTLFSLQKPKRPDYGFFRYYIDRVFSVKGSGTVVTGTVLSGQVKQKEQIFVCENQKKVQVKAIQTQNESADSIGTGSRAALNLSGIDTKSLGRGMQLSNKGFLRGFKTIDVHLGLLDIQTAVHNKNVQLFMGSQKYNAKVLLLQQQGLSCFATLVTDAPVFSVFKDRFILRQNAETIGGGQVLNPIADPMKKAQRIELMEYLQKDDFKKAFTLLTRVHKKGFGLVSSLQRFGLNHDRALLQVQSYEDLFVDEQGLVVYPNQSVSYLRQSLERLYEKNPYALTSAKFVATRYNWVSPVLAQYVLGQMQTEGIVRFENGLYTKTGVQKQQVEDMMQQRIYELLQESKLTPKAPYNMYEQLDLDRKSGDAIFKKLCSAQKVKRLAHNYFITTDNLHEAREVMKSIIEKEGYIDVQKAKARLGFSRKYIIALLEYLDTLPYITTQDNRRYLTQ